MSLSKSELERYQRQLLIDGWDQNKLKNARVLIAGLGGLGGVSAFYLAAAGVGNIRLCDSDKIELSNLNRQILYSSNDIGKSKSIIAQKRLLELNPDIKIEALSDKLTEINAFEITSGCDIIIDGLDNHRDRLILNRVSFALEIPYIYAAINEWQGQLGFINPPVTPCLACLMPQRIIDTGPIPVLGAVAGVIGSFQSALAIRYLITGETPLAGKLLIFRADKMEFETLIFDKNPECPVCS
jgi:molybdopterin/thiamine biosynthesis adenylyltransferase